METNKESSFVDPSAEVRNIAGVIFQQCKAREEPDRVGRGKRRKCL